MKATRSAGLARSAAVLAIGVAATLGTSALADVKAGVDAWGAGDFPMAVREWQGAADAGDADAQFNLAQAYRLGRGVPRDLSRAEALFGAAAAKGHLQAADNYGLLLFNRGERAKAMPFVRAAAGRGDPRAQYILGLALFNGDGMAKDWVRAYAYLTLAQQAGLPPATAALKQMDQHVSMADRQKSVAVAAQIASETEATRARQLAAADLGVESGRTIVGDGDAGAPGTSRGPSIATVERAVADAERVAGSASPSTAGADYTVTKPRVAMNAPRPVPARPVPSATATPAPTPSREPASTKATAPAKVPARQAATPVAGTSGPWRLQLGAFGVAGNADGLWARVRARPELAGRSKLLVPAGSLTKLQAGGFASQAEANAACARLKAGGFTCLATRN